MATALETRDLAARIAALAIASAMIKAAGEALDALAEHQPEIGPPVILARQEADRALSRVNALIAAALPD